MPALAVLTVILIWRKVPRQFPFFFYYIILGVLIGIVRLWLYGPSPVYFYVYWITDLLIAIAAFLATYELFVRRLFPAFHTIRLYRILFPVAAAVIALGAVPGAIQLHRMWIVLRTIHVFEVLRVAILIFFVGLMVFMGRQWRRYEFGIALGLGIQASALLITSARWARSSAALASSLPVISYDLACLIWLITFSKPEEQSAPAKAVSPEVIQRARKWEETLKESLTKKRHSEE